MATEDFTTYWSKLLVRLSQDKDVLNNPHQLVKVLRHIADKVQQTIPPSVPYYKPLPPELDTPETGWPYLLARFPDVFDGITLSSEPYYSYLKKSRPQQDAQAIAHLNNPSQADVAEALFGDRGKTGGSYRRRILAALEATTTTQQADNPPNKQKAA